MEPQVVTDTEASPKLSVGKRIAFSLVLLFILAVIVELSASLYLRTVKGYDGEHLLQYSFDSYKNILPTPGYADTRGVHHNAVGFRRDGEVALTKPAGTFRIFLMGGSTAFGTGGLWTHIDPKHPVLANDSTIDRYLERYLAAARPDLKFEVINAAIPSTWTHHSFIYLNQSILRYSPDMVLFLDGFNDFYQCTEDHDQFASYVYGERATVIMGEPSLMALVQANGWWIARKSAAAYLAFRTAQSIGAAVNKPRDRAPLDVERCFTTMQRIFPANALTMWRRSAVLLAHEGVQAVFMLQPLLVLDRDRKGLTTVERELYDFNVASWLPGHDEYMRRAAPWVSDTARRTLTPLGGRFLDLTGIFRDAEGQIYTDYAHLTPQGNAILARVVADSITPMVRLAPPAASVLKRP
jgi:hypothetical protein